MIHFPLRIKLPPQRVVLWWMVSALPLAVIVGVGAYLSYHYHQLLKESRDRVDQNYETLDTLRRLFEAVTDAEAGQRGFILTGDEAYLLPYSYALESAPKTYGVLRTLVPAGVEASGSSSIQQLEQLIAAELIELGRGIDLRRRDGFEAARLEMQSGPEKRLMDAVRVQVTAMAAQERNTLLSSHDDARRKERKTWLIVATVAAVSISTRLGIALTMAHLRRRRKRKDADSVSARAASQGAAAEPEE